jgi:phosphatidylserine/phosphatidylglycerophosphate/cardiolipin synthase-like enzyme
MAALARTFTPLARIIAALGLLLLAACSTLPSRPPEPPTAAIADFSSTPLAAITQKRLPFDGRSGFQLQPYGPNSFATRVTLAELAVRSLDVQYYILRDDNSGLVLMRALRDAAARGVRVRLLVDDMYTAGEDELLLALASYPNVEVRLFNPFPGGRGSLVTRFIASGLGDFARVNRRMHNKLFVADNAAAVAGGRNVGDEYFMNAMGSNFVDMDVFAAGPVVRDLSNEFDSYWNSDVVFPLQAIAQSTLSRAQLQENFDRRVGAAAAPIPVHLAPDGSFTRDQRLPDDVPPDAVTPELVPMLNLPFELAAGSLSPLLPANARVLFDPLAKAAGFYENGNSIKGTVTEGVVGWLHTARRHVKIVTPYFVPGDSGVKALAEARKDGIEIELVTNSLASTDVPFSYVSYWSHMKELLQSGVEIREISPTLSVKRHRLGVFGNRRGSLHMKNAIVDHRQVFLGSMNLDQRSARINTEIGLIIDSPEMAAQLEGFSDAGSAYRLRLNPEGHIEWVARDEDKEVVFDVPPESSAWQRFELTVLGPLLPEGEF